MGRIAKIKRLLIEEANKRLLGEEDPVGGDPNAGEIQKYLVDKGYLPRYRTENGEKKDNIDWDFADISAKAFGDFIKDKLGVDVGIQSLQDLQDYLDLLGFETGDLGFGEKVYNAIKWIIDFTEKGVSDLINNPKINKITKSLINIISKNLIGKQITKIDVYSEGEHCDTHVNYFSKLTDIEITEITDKTFKIKGTVNGDLKVGACEWFDIKDNYEINKNLKNFTVDFETEFKYHFAFKDGNFCFLVDVIDASINTPDMTYFGKLPGINEIYFYLNIFMNNVTIQVYMTYFPSKNKQFKGSESVDNVDTVNEIKKSICSKGYCIGMDDIIKLIRGQENISNISNLMVDMCPPAPDYSIVDSPIPDFSETIKHMMPKDLHNYLFKMSLYQQKEWRKTPKNLELLKKWISENPGTYQRIIDLNQHKSPTKLV